VEYKELTALGLSHNFLRLLLELKFNVLFLSDVIVVVVVVVPLGCVTFY